MAVYLAPGPFGAGYQAFDSNGVPLNGGFIYTYAAGTTTTQATFTTSTGNVTNATPIVLSSDGRPQNSGNLVEIWLTSGIAYKFTITDSTNNQIAVYDNLTGINDIGAQSEWIVGAGPTFVSATQFTVAGNQALTYDVGRRVKAVVTSGTIYGTVSIVSATTSATAVTVDWDSTQLDAGLSVISYAMLDAAHPSMPTAYMDQPTETVTAAATVDLGIIRARSVNITGSTGITRLSIPDGQVRFLQFNNQVTLSNNVSQLLTVTAGNTITTNTGDVAIVRGEPGLARMIGFTRNNGLPLALSIATQAQQEAGTVTSAVVTPLTQQFHPTSLKAWVHGNMASGINASYNVASVTDVGVGVATPVYVTAFSSANYAAIACPYVASDTFGIIFNSLGGRTTTACATAYVSSTTHTTADPTEFHFMAAGDWA